VVFCEWGEVFATPPPAREVLEPAAEERAPLLALVAGRGLDAPEEDDRAPLVFTGREERAPLLAPVAGRGPDAPEEDERVPLVFAGCEGRVPLRAPVAGRGLAGPEEDDRAPLVFAGREGRVPLRAPVAGRGPAGPEGDDRAPLVFAGRGPGSGFDDPEVVGFDGVTVRLPGPCRLGAFGDEGVRRVARLGVTGAGFPRPFDFVPLGVFTRGPPLFLGVGLEDGRSGKLPITVSWASHLPLPPGFGPATHWTRNPTGTLPR
jgi:hypothetical protein